MPPLDQHGTHCIPTYMLSSGLISAGMNWWQALIPILWEHDRAGSILLNSHRAQVRRSLPRIARAAYGTTARIFLR